MSEIYIFILSVEREILIYIEIDKKLLIIINIHCSLKHYAANTTS